MPARTRKAESFPMAMEFLEAESPDKAGSSPKAECFSKAEYFWQNKNARNFVSMRNRRVEKLARAGISGIQFFAAFLTYWLVLVV
jgi:hypothetical protein